MKVRLVLQYFDGCPNHGAMREHLLQAIRGIEEKVDLTEVRVEDRETAGRVQFRGSPTLLINGEDLVGMPPPDDASLSCRFYPQGVPSAAFIRQKLERAFTHKGSQR
jgi:hypothetical protein